jgi:thiol:disulfide interchange protein DsbC
MEKRKAFFQQNIRELDDLTLFSFNPGKCNKILYVVTDPNCPYCKQLMPDLEILAMENQLEIKVILFPVLGSKSRDMAIQAICGEYSYQEYRQIQLQPDTSGCRQADILLEKTMPFFSKTALSFVPVVISGDGTWVVEGNDISQVKQHLGIACDDDGAGDPSKGCAPIPEN